MKKCFFVFLLFNSMLFSIEKETTWVDRQPGNYWGTGKCWSNGVARPNDMAIFNNPSLYCSLDGNIGVAEAKFNFGASTETIKIGGSPPFRCPQYTITSTPGAIRTVEIYSTDVMGKPLNNNVQTVINVSGDGNSYANISFLNGIRRTQLGQLSLSNKIVFPVIELEDSQNFLIENIVLDQSSEFNFSYQQLPELKTIDIKNNSQLIFNLSSYTLDSTVSVSLGGTPSVFSVPTAGYVATIPGRIIGSGGFSKTGDGTLILSGTNTFTGGTILTAGTLKISSGSNLGDPSSVFTYNGGLLEFTSALSTSRNFVLASGDRAIQTDSGTSTLSGIISGDGTLNKTGSGLLILTGSNTYTGGTLISAGVLQTSVAGLGTGIVNNMTSLIFDEASNATYDEIIYGSGSVTKQNTGTLTLTAVNSYLGDTIINGGAIVFSSVANLGSSLNSLVFNGGTLSFISSDFSCTLNKAVTLQASGGTFQIPSTRTVALTNLISGTGSLSVSGSGFLSLTGTNTYTGGTILRGGTLTIDGDANLGDTSGTVTLNGGRLAFLDSISSARNFILSSGGGTLLTGAGNCTLSGVISGSGSLTKTGSDSLILTGTNTCSGVLTILAGTLQALAQSLSFGSIVNNASLVLNQPAGEMKTCSSSISGSGSITKQNPGSVALIGSNSYSGGTTISSGILYVRGDSLGTGNVLNNASLVFDQPANTSKTCSVAISGTGSVTKSNYGTVNLGGVNTYTGGTIVSIGGALTINSGASILGVIQVVKGGTIAVASGGSITSADITVAAGGTVDARGLISCGADFKSNGLLTGTGTIKLNGFHFDPPVKLRPGNSPGTMVIEGDVDLGELDLEFDFSEGSELIITGNLNIEEGAVINLIIDKPTSEQDIFNFFVNGFSFPFIDAGSITGSFAGFVSPYPGFQFSILQNGNEYTLDVEALPLASLVSDPNQKAVANVFDEDYSSQSPDFLEANMELYFLQLPALQNALNALHPALFNGIALAQEETTTYITKVVSQRLEEITWKNPDLKERKWNVWGQGIRDYARQQGKRNLRGYHATTPGVIVGADVKIFSNFALGFQGSYTNTHIGWEAHQGYGHTTTGYGGLYGSWYNDYLLVGLSLLGGWNSSKATRSIDFGEIERNAHHRQHGWEIAPQLELGGLYEMKYISFQPFLKENYVYLHQNHYREHGAESLCLDVKEKSADLLRSEIGLGLFHCFKGKQLQFSPEIKGSYILESRFQGKKTTAYFLNDTVQPFTVKGLSPSRSLGHIGVLLKGSSYNGFDLTLDYNFQFGKKYRDHKMALRLNYAF